MDERRHHTNRIEIGTALTIDLDGESIQAHVLNVSFGGVLLNADARPELGSEVRLSGENMTPVSGTVVRLEDNGFAVDLGESVASATFAVESITSGMVPASESEPESADEKNE